MAEAHPVGFRWVMKARERGATIIHVDPRFSRTSAMADMHVPIRAGTRHRLPRRPDPPRPRDRVATSTSTSSHYTNAATIVSEDFQDTEDLGGFFSGFDAETGTYDPTTWMYEGGEVAAAGRAARARHAVVRGARPAPGCSTARSQRDETLQHPRCVFHSCKRHFARYTPEMVERICGISQEQFHQVAETLIANSGRERTTALCYAVGWTQHTAGVQMIRAGAILQLLLGNIGRPGGGDHGAARARVDPGLDRHPDALRPAARLPARCRRRARTSSTLESYIDTGGSRPRLVVELRQVHRLAAEGLVRRRRDGRERLRLRATCRRSPATTRTSRRCCARSTAASTACS